MESFDSVTVSIETLLNNFYYSIEQGFCCFRWEAGLGGVACVFIDKGDFLSKSA
jgi:hypothetical protein